MLNFRRNCPTALQWLDHFAFPPTMYKRPAADGYNNKKTKQTKNRKLASIGKDVEKFGDFLIIIE